MFTIAECAQIARSIAERANANTQFIFPQVTYLSSGGHICYMCRGYGGRYAQPPAPGGNVMLEIWSYLEKILDELLGEVWLGIL